MSNENLPTGRSSLEHKQLLIAQGRLYRLGLLESRGELQASLRPERLVKAALGNFSDNASGLLGQVLGLGGINVAQLGQPRVWLPLAFSVVSLLAKRRGFLGLSRRTSGLLGVAAAAAYLVKRWYKVKHQGGSGDSQQY